MFQMPAVDAGQAMAGDGLRGRTDLGHDGAGAPKRGLKPKEQ
jgi:hypothetical protein